MLQIVYCCNDKYFEGLYLSILSIINRCNKDICFTILTANLTNIGKTYKSLSNYHISLLEQLIKSKNSNNEIRVENCSNDYLKEFGQQDIERYSPYTMIKLFIPRYFDCGNVLYVDTDIMANGDISPIFDIDMSNTELCVCHDYYRQIKLKNPESKYFSGGVWLINIDEVKKTNLFNKAIDYFNQYHPFGNEEASLNETATKIKYFPNNDYDYNWQGPGIGPNTILKHFVYTGQRINIKQWDITGVTTVLELHNWDNDFRYFLQQRENWIKPKQIYNVLYSCNDKLFDGLYLSILSVVKRTKHPINFFVMTGDLSYINSNYQSISQRHINILENMIKSFNPNSTLTILDCSKLYKDTFGDNFDVFQFTPYALFRLLIHNFNNLEGLILYLDVDTLANDDITQAWAVNMNCVEACVCHDLWLNQHRDPKYHIFNSGVMLINLDFIRITKYFDLAIKYLIDKKPDMADQQALFETWYRLKIWKDEYRFNYQNIDIQPNTIIKHFNATSNNSINGLNVKPWDIDKVQNLLNLHNWDEDYKYFLDQKKKLDF